jgi:hypothetical protein
MLMARTQRKADQPRKGRLARGRWQGVLLVFCTVLVGGACAAACAKKDIPPSLPRTQIYQRFAPRVELVELVIKDEKRAETVKDLYIQIEDTFYEQGLQAAKNLKALAGHKEQLTDNELRATFDTFRAGERAAYDRYIALQMKIRKAVNREEFAHLNALR